MMKLRLDQRRALLGYEMRLIIDDDSRAAAERDGFSIQRTKAPERVNSGRGVS